MICTRCHSEHSSVRVQGPIELWACSCPLAGFTALAGTPQDAQDLLASMPLKTPARASKSNAKKTTKKKG